MRDVAQPFLGPLAKLGIVLIFTVFLLVEETDLRNRIFRLAGLNRLNVMTQAVEDGTRRVSRYLVLQLLRKSRLRRTLWNRSLCDRRALCRAVGRSGGPAPHCAVRRIGRRGSDAAAAFARGL